LDSWGESLGEYIGTFVEDVMEGVGAEIERSLFVDPHIRHRHRERRRQPMDTKAASEAMSALGNEHRIKILEELSFGGHYANELQESLSGISASTLSSHLDILQESGLIVQERRRGRYLITIPGRLAVKMAYQIADRIDRSREFR
jgi:DNA-binding transcriptional ArsR family regulator